MGAASHSSDLSAHDGDLLQEEEEQAFARIRSLCEADNKIMGQLKELRGELRKRELSTLACHSDSCCCCALCVFVCAAAGELRKREAHHVSTTRLTHAQSARTATCR